MFTTNFLPILLDQLKICDYFKVSVFLYNKKSGTFEKNNSFSRLFTTKFLHILQLTHIIVITMGGFNNTSSFTERIQATLFILSYTCLMIMRWNFNADTKPIRLINAFLKFEKGLMGGNLVNFKINLII